MSIEKIFTITSYPNLIAYSTVSSLSKIFLSDRTSFVLAVGYLYGYLRTQGASRLWDSVCSNEP